MRAFLFCHMTDDVALFAVSQHRKLAFIDADSPVFAGMVDADNAFQQLFRRQIARQNAVFGSLL